MLLKKETTSNTDFLEDWPVHYHEIKTALQRKDILEKAIAQNLDPVHNTYRMKLLEKRFFSMNKKGTVDSFMRAWIMIHAAAAANDSVLIKRQQRELIGYLKDLCLYDYIPENEAERQILVEEWTDFIKSYLLSCIGNKNYCSTFFNMISLKDEAIARKIADEIDLVTRIYPSKFGLADFLVPFRHVVISTYSRMIEHGESYFP